MFIFELNQTFSRTSQKPKGCGPIQESLDKLTKVLKFPPGKLTRFIYNKKPFLITQAVDFKTGFKVVDNDTSVPHLW